MRVAWATAHLPDPTLGGGWALEYEVLRHAAARHDIVVLSGELAPGAPVPEVLGDLGVEVRGVARVNRTVPRGSRFLAERVRHRMPTGVWSAAPTLEALSTALVAAERAAPFDLVHVMPQEAAALTAVARAPAALFLGDSFRIQADREAATAAGKDRVRVALEQWNAGRWEARWFPRASAVACVSSADAEVIERRYGIDVDVVPIPIGNEWFAPPAVARKPDVVALIGALDYGPNTDAVLWFTSDIWPRVRSRVPSARLRITGRRPPPALLAAAEAAGGEVLADVPDVRPYYWEAAVVVAPIRLGSGVKNKVLHAAACRAPQVGTTFAFDGTGARAGSDVLMADDAEGLADAVVACLHDPGAAAERASAAVRVADNHRIDRVGAAFDLFWEHALESAGRES